MESTNPIGSDDNDSDLTSRKFDNFVVDEWTVRMFHFDDDVDDDDVEQEKDVKVCLLHAKIQVSAPKSTKRNQKEPTVKCTTTFHKSSQSTLGNTIPTSAKKNQQCILD